MSQCQSSLQARVDSALEAITNILVGAGIALLAQMFLFPLMEKDFTMGEHLITTAFFTFISFVRSYSIRRLFNGKTVYQAIKGRLTR